MISSYLSRSPSTHKHAMRLWRVSLLSAVQPAIKRQAGPWPMQSSSHNPVMAGQWAR